MNNNDEEETTITDRLALGYGGAFTTFITGAILWLCINWFLLSATQTVSLPFYLDWLLTILGFILGTLTLENHLLKILSSIWQFLNKVISKLMLFH